MVDGKEFAGELPRILAAMDQPSIDALNTWFVSKAARELDLKVALSGVGADELLGGYPGFTQIPRMVSLLRGVSWIPGLGSLAARALRGVLPALGVHPKWAGALRYGGTLPGAYFLRRALFLPFELPEIMDPAAAREGLRRLRPEAYLAGILQQAPRSPYARIAVLETSTYMRNQLLRDCDWAGMAHGVEIRVPFVDAMLYRRVAPLLATLRRAPGKRILARVPQRLLPRQLLHRPKSGFETPVQGWMRTHCPDLSSGPVEAAPMRDWARLVAGQLGVEELRS